ncbi:MAG: phage holin family protein [Schleiferiaceae bacterium]|jgi:putative membrane protein|nr:phage holin family protein [Schleiferiaceae bacterium]
MENDMRRNSPGLIMRLVVNTLSVFATAWLLKGIHVEDFKAALIVAIVLAILNVTLKPFLIIITLPLTIFTLGFFLLVINAIVVLLAQNWIDGFYVDGWLWAILFSLIMSFINSVLYKLGGND